MQQWKNIWPAPTPPEDAETTRLRLAAHHAKWRATKDIVKWTLMGVGAWAVVQHIAEQRDKDK